MVKRIIMMFRTIVGTLGLLILMSCHTSNDAEPNANRAIKNFDQTSTKVSLPSRPLDATRQLICNKTPAVTGWAEDLTQEMAFVVQSGHSGHVTTIDISPDGRLIASGAPDGVVKLWDTVSGKLVRNLRKHSDIVTSVIFSPDGKTVASGSFDGTINFWNTKKETLSLTMKSGHTSSIAFSPDGTTLISGGEDVKFWNVKTGKLLKKWEKPKKVSSLSISPDGMLLAVTQRLGIDTSNQITIWRIASGKRIAILKGHSRTARQVTFSPNGNILASAGRDGMVRIWDVNKGIERMKLAGHVKPVYAVAFSPDGDLLASGSTDETVRIYKISARETIHILKGKKISRTLSKRNPEYLMLSDEPGGRLDIMDPDGLFIMKRAMKTDGNIMLNTTFPNDRKSLRHINMGSPSELLRLVGLSRIATCVRFSPDGKYIISGCGDTVRMWDIKNGAEIKIFSGSSDIPSSITFSPTKRILATGNVDGRVHLWDLSTAIQMRMLSGHFTPVRTITFSPNSKFLVTGSDAGIVKVWNIESGDELMVLVGHMDRIISVAVSPNSRYIASYSFDGMLRIWDAHSGSEIIQIKKSTIQTNRYAPLIFSPDSKSVLFCTFFQDKIEVIDVLNGDVIKSIQTPKDSGSMVPVHLTFGQNGKKFIGVFSTNNKQIVRTWNFQKNKKVDARRVPEIPIGAIAFISKDKEILCITENRIVKVWDAATGDELRSYKLSSKGAASLAAISTNNNMLATVSPDGETSVFNLSTGQHLVNLIAGEGEDYLITSTDNYYRSSRGGLASVAFRFGNRAYPFDQFDLQLNQPHQVLMRLDSPKKNLIKAYKSAYEMRLRREGVAVEQPLKDASIPNVSIVGPVPVSSEKEKIELKICASSPQHRLARLKVYVNNVPVYGVKGLDLSKLNKFLIEKKVKLELSPGKNNVRFSVLNELGIESLSESVDIYCIATKQIPDLYVAVVGISEYMDKRWRLVYASKDAADIAELFESQRSRFRRIKTLRILDKEATRKNVIKLERVLGKTKLDDHVVIFLAGHGVLDKHFNYYFAPCDMNFDNPSARGISFEEIERILEKIPARKKLLLMDTCHSGEFEKEEIVATLKKRKRNGSRGSIRAFPAKRGVALIADESVYASDLLRTLFADLRRGTGAIVISASSGREFAYEDTRWKNGVFSYSIIEGLKLGIADNNFDRQVTVSELRDYVTKRVAELTAYRQTPTSRRENLAMDYVLYETQGLPNLEKPWESKRLAVPPLVSSSNNKRSKAQNANSNRPKKRFQPLNPIHQTESQKAVSLIVNAFFKTIAKNDVYGVKKLWSKKALNSESFAEVEKLPVTLQHEIKSLAPNVILRGIECKEVNIMRIHILKNSARTWGVTIVRGINPQTGKGEDVEVAVLFGLRLVLQNDNWKIVEYGHPQTRFVIDLAKEPSSKKRVQLLMEDRDLIDSPLIKMFRRSALKHGDQGKFQEAHLLADITIECGTVFEDKSILADAYIAKSIIYFRESKLKAALENVKEAINWFYKDNDRKAVARALLNYGSFANEDNREAMALEVLESSQYLMRQMGDQETLSQVLISAAEAWVKIGNYSKALDTYHQCLRNLSTSDSSNLKLRALIGITQQYIQMEMPLEAIRICNLFRQLSGQIGLNDEEKDVLESLYKKIRKISKTK